MTEEERFRLLVEAVKDYAIFMLDPDGAVASWNAGAERMTGYTGEEILGRHFRCFYAAEDVTAGRPERELADAASHGRSEAEGWRIRKDGSRLWANTVMTAVYDDAGRLSGFARMTRDVTATKRAEQDRERLLEAMEGQRRLFEMVLDHAPAGIAIFDGSSLRVKWANPMFRQRLDPPWNATDITGKRLEELMPAAISGVTEIFRRVAETRKPHFEPEFEVPGAQRYLRVSLLPLAGGERGRAPDLMMLVTDISDSVLARKQVERANSLKSEFLASMSHELRTPLHTIGGFADLLAKGKAGELNAKQRRQVERIQQASHHLLSLINDILDLSKIEAGRMELRLENFVADSALAEVLSTITPLAEGKSIHVAANLPPGLVVRADRVRFKQILYNLLSNAVKFTPAEGSVWVEAEAGVDFAAFTVGDTGVGIAPEDQRAIFDEFRQVGVTTKGVREGTGLGLAITRRLLGMHGGAITVESEPGKGSRFRFRLPRRAHAKAPQPAAAAEAGPRAPEAAGRTILVADDSAPAREWARDVFEPLGYRVIEAVDGGDAVRQVERENPDLVLMDIQMPVIDGYAALARLRENARFARLPVIALTAFAMQGDRERALAAGFDGYVAKPVAAGALEAEVRRLLS
ncbi:MAG: ATP-binding protein [Bryobacteraceae bacterium]